MVIGSSMDNDAGLYVMSYEWTAYPSGQSGRSLRNAHSRQQCYDLIDEWNRLGAVPRKAPMWSYRLLSIRFNPHG